MQSPTPARTRRVRAMLAITTLAFLAVAVCSGTCLAAGAQPQIESVAGLLPSNTSFVSVTDLRWWWRAGDPVRKIPDVAKAIDDFQKKSKITIDRDIAPWAGQVGIAFVRPFMQSDFGGSGVPNSIAFLIQVRNWPAYERFDKATSKVYAQPSEYQKTERYRGIVVKVDATSTAFVDCWVIHGNWIVVAESRRGMHHIIDVWVHRRASLLAKAHMASAIRTIDPRAVLWWALDTGSLVQSSATAAKSQGPDYRKLEALLDFSCAGDMVDLGDGLRFDESSTPNTRTTRRFFELVAARLPPLRSNLYSHLPNGTIALVAISNPDGYVNLVTDIVQRSLDRSDRRDFRKALREGRPFLSLLSRFHHDVSAELVYKDGDGFGGLAQSEADSPRYAQIAAARLANGLSNNGTSMVKLGSLWTQEGYGRMSFDTVPALHARGAILEGATAPGWLSGGYGPAHLPGPGGQVMPQAILAGTFGFLPGLRQYIAQQPGSNPIELEAYDSLVIATHLGQARYLCTNYYSRDGTVRQTFVIDNWDWRAGLSDTIAVMTKFKDLFSHLVPNTPDESLAPATAPFRPLAKG